MKRYFRRLSYLWILLATPLAASTSLIYVVNSAGTTISVIDSATNKVVQTIKNIEGPEAAKFSLDGSRVYITNKSTDLFVVDRKTGNHIKKVPLSGLPNDLEVTTDGKRVLVCISETRGALDIIDTTSLEKVKSIPTKRSLHDVYVTRDGKYAIAGTEESNVATVFDLKSEQIAWEIPFDQEGILPMAIESGPDGSATRLFQNLRGLNGFAVVDFAKRKEVARIKLPELPGGFGRGSSSSHGIGLAPDGKTLWVVSRVANAVFVYSVPELKLLGHVPSPVLKLPGRPPLGAHQHWFTFSGDSKTAYVSNLTTRSVSAIDVKTMKEVAQIPVGEMPLRVSTLVLP